jgi:hypothetical protein
MVQVPAATPVTVLPLTVQVDSVLLVKPTVRPEVAVALAVVVPLAAKEVGRKLMAPMVWLLFATAMVCVTWAAAA